MNSAALILLASLLCDISLSTASYFNVGGTTPAASVIQTRNSFQQKFSWLESVKQQAKKKYSVSNQTKTQKKSGV